MIDLGNFSEQLCPDCGGMEVHSEYKPHRFPVICGVNGEIHRDELEVIVPVVCCEICNFQYLDYRSEDITFAAQRDWIFEKTGITIDSLGNVIS